MALIECPECGGKVSDKAENCIHCGYPLHTQEKTTVNHQSAKMFEKRIYICPKCHNAYSIKDGEPDLSCPSCGIRLLTTDWRVEDWRALSEDEKDKIKTDIVSNKESMKVRCPRCYSDSVVTLARGYSLWTGFFGSGAARNVCQVCGYKWKPDKYDD